MSRNMCTRWLKVLLHGLAAFSLAALAPLTLAPAASDDFSATVRPFLNKNCLGCHNTKLKSAGLNLESADRGGASEGAAATWDKVLAKLGSGEMPPPGAPRPDAASLRDATSALEKHLERLAAQSKPDPGRVTARRLNRAEYNNTIRDLLAVDFRPADDFPADDSGYGFDNIGDVLSVSPMLMERYMAAARQVARKAIQAGGETAKPTVERFPANRDIQARVNLRPGEVRSELRGGYSVRHEFPADGDYTIRVRLVDRRSDRSASFQVALSLDDQPATVFAVDTPEDAPRGFETTLPLPAGKHTVRAVPVAEHIEETAAKGGEAALPGSERKLFVDYIEVAGPFNPRLPAIPESHRRVFVCGHDPGKHSAQCALPAIENLTRRAFRRPVESRQVDQWLSFVSQALERGEPLEEGIRVALQAILVSPRFLFRVERDPDPSQPAGVRRVDDFELASRLSYFLWSSMPDEDLFHAAHRGVLRRPKGLQAQVKRMLADHKSKALAENFAGQWLQVRNLRTARPDPEKFPEFDEELREAMLRETELFFDAVVREDRGIIDFIEGPFTFLNERLAQHYGINGVTGRQFRRVELQDERRGGVLAHASVLTVTSYPTRTSPVLRGLWILENFLAAPPPPPPPDVPQLSEAGLGTATTLRERLEKHRADPSCAVCHNRMDPLGFGLENYDATGAWRTHDGQFPVDVAGTLPGGRSFRGPAELKSVLASDREAFARCFTEKLLTYALGRGLEYYDKPAVESIVAQAVAGEYRMHSLITGIVTSMPFQMRRGDTVKP